LSTEAHPIEVFDTAPNNYMRADEIAIETAKTSKVAVVVAMMRFFCRKKCKSRSANPSNEKPSRQKTKSSSWRRITINQESFSENEKRQVIKEIST
jgi:hypothetical protein